MMARLSQIFTHRTRKQQTADTVHALRNRAQVAEAEKALIKKAQETGDLMWLEDALTRRQVRQEERQL